MNQIQSLACSSDEGILFVGGGEDSVSGKPSLAAVTFNKDVKLVVEQELNFEGLSIVYCLKTFEESNLLFAGTFSAILIVYYHEQTFSVISKIADVLPDEVSHLRYIDNHLFLASPSKTAIVRLSFPKLAADNRRKSVLGAFNPSFVGQLANHTVEKISLPSNSV